MNAEQNITDIDVFAGKEKEERRKGKEGKGREGKGREGKGREGKGREYWIKKKRFIFKILLSRLQSHPTYLPSLQFRNRFFSCLIAILGQQLRRLYKLRYGNRKGDGG
jgi:hypothetical protein